MYSYLLHIDYTFWRQVFIVILHRAACHSHIRGANHTLTTYSLGCDVSPKHTGT